LIESEYRFLDPGCLDWCFLCLLPPMLVITSSAIFAKFPRRNPMTIFGKSLSEYVRFQRPILGFILLVGVTRLALSLAGVSSSAVKYFSITAAGLLGLVVYSICVHTRSFGSYKELLVLLGIQNLTAQLFTALAVVLAILTGQDNIFSIPEYSGGADGKTWGHAGAHVFLATPILTLIGWAIGSLILYVTKKVAPNYQQDPAPGRKARAAKV
jgi:hypothetical protein